MLKQAHTGHWPGEVHNSLCRTARTPAMRTREGASCATINILSTRTAFGLVALFVLLCAACATSPQNDVVLPGGSTQRTGSGATFIAHAYSGYWYMDAAKTFWTSTLVLEIAEATSPDARAGTATMMIQPKPPNAFCRGTFPATWALLNSGNLEVVVDRERCEPGWKSYFVLEPTADGALLGRYATLRRTR
jgi:hypothetical protein